MRLTKEIIIGDILEYEMFNDVNVLEELQNCNLSIVIDLISLGNKCSEEDAEKILYKELNDRSLTEVVEQLAYEIIGKEPEENEKCIESNEIKSFSDILEDFYNQLQTVDDSLRLSEFQNMSTRYLYRYADGVQKRYIHNKNEEYKSQYTNVAMFMSALAGKLKECPQLNEDGTVHKKSLEEKLRDLRVGGA